MCPTLCEGTRYEESHANKYFDFHSIFILKF